jgi:hypothetical protein
MCRSTRRRLDRRRPTRSEKPGSRRRWHTPSVGQALRQRACGPIARWSTSCVPPGDPSGMVHPDWHVTRVGSLPSA